MTFLFPSQTLLLTCFCTIVPHLVALVVGLVLVHTLVPLVQAGLVPLEALHEVVVAAAAVAAVHPDPGHGRSTDDLAALRQLPLDLSGSKSEALALYHLKFAFPSSHATSIRDMLKKFFLTMVR